MPQTITTTATDAYKLAAKYLGDATQFIRIMQANGMSDPVVSGPPRAIIIPDPDLTKTGGVPVI
jgi:hypothetical protein